VANAVDNGNNNSNKPDLAAAADASFDDVGAKTSPLQADVPLGKPVDASKKTADEDDDDETIKKEEVQEEKKQLDETGNGNSNSNSIKPDPAAAADASFDDVGAKTSPLQADVPVDASKKTTEEDETIKKEEVQEEKKQLDEADNDTVDGGQTAAQNDVPADAADAAPVQASSNDGDLLPAAPAETEPEEPSREDTALSDREKARQAVAQRLAEIRAKANQQSSIPQSPSDVADNVQGDNANAAVPPAADLVADTSSTPNVGGDNSGADGGDDADAGSSFGFGYVGWFLAIGVLSGGFMVYRRKIAGGKHQNGRRQYQRVPSKPSSDST
jgi:hypothetical protein